MKHSITQNNRFPIFTERFRALQGGRSNTEFAEFLGMSRQTVGFYCNGNRVPDAVALRQIVEKCQVSADWLLGLSDVRHINGELSQVCEYTGLNERAVEQLHSLSTRRPNPCLMLLQQILEPSFQQYWINLYRAMLLRIHSKKFPDRSPRFDSSKLLEEICTDDPDLSWNIEISPNVASRIYQQNAERIIECAVSNTYWEYLQTVEKIVESRSTSGTEHTESHTDEKSSAPADPSAHEV